MISQKKNVLFFPFNLMSHYLRCLVLADTYDKEQFNIWFLSSPDYNHFVARHGYKTFNALQFDADHVLACARNFSFSWLREGLLEDIMLDQLRAIRTYQADIVIADVAPTLKIAAQLGNAVHISLLNGYMTRYYARTRKLSVRHKAHFIIKLLPDGLADALTDMGEHIAFKKVQKPFNKIRRKYGLAEVSDYLTEIEGEVNLVCDLPSLFPQKMLPPSFRVIGPLLYKHQDLQAQHLPELPPDKPVICVCMGSSGDWHRLRFLNKADYAGYTLVTAGDKKRVITGPHVISLDFIDLDQLLPHCNLMICHGGNGTMYAGIVNQVFMLCLANHFEQEWNIAALTEAGYGKSAEGFNEASWHKHIAACCTYSGTQPALSL